MSNTEAARSADILSFPARRLDAAREVLQDAHRRLVRAAAKSGQNIPDEPRIDVTREGWASRCTECKSESDSIRGGRCMVPGCDGIVICRPIVDLRIAWSPLRLAGWEFLAVVEPLIGGNLIRQVPGAQIAQGELSAWRTADMDCDHCKTNRQRSETFVVRADGTDPAIAAGTHKCVGRNCLAAFLGGRSPDALISSLGWRELVIRSGGDGEWGGGDSYFESIEFLSWAVAVVRIDGWTSRTVARDSDRQASADLAIELLVPPYGPGRARWIRLRETYQPSDADLVRAKSILAWAREIPAPGSDYEQNLRLVASQPALDRKHAGILASAIAAHDRQLGELAKRQARISAGASSRHLGTIGEKRDFGRVTCEAINSYDNDYGTVHVHTFRDEDGCALVWKTGRRKANQGDTVAMLTGTIKKHGAFRGEAQTELSRCNLLSEAELITRSATKVKKPRTKANPRTKTAPQDDVDEPAAGCP